jgi:hypothetical protein
MGVMVAVFEVKKEIPALELAPGIIVETQKMGETSIRKP